MTSFADVADRKLTWHQPSASERTYELRAGDDRVAELRFRSAWGTLRACAVSPCHPVRPGVAVAPWDTSEAAVPRGISSADVPPSRAPTAARPAVMAIPSRKSRRERGRSGPAARVGPSDAEMSLMPRASSPWPDTVGGRAMLRATFSATWCRNYPAEVTYGNFWINPEYEMAKGEAAARQG